jgi:hypothetical protein
MGRIVTVALMLFLVPCADAMACSGPALTPRQRVKAVKLAAFVQVVSTRALGSTANGATRWEATVRRIRTFKGRPRQVFTVRAQTDEASCGLARFKKGKRVGLLMDPPGPPYRIGLFSTISLSDLRRAVG